MLSLVLHGLNTGVVTTKYPFQPEDMPEGYVGGIDLLSERLPGNKAKDCEEICPTSAIEALPDGGVRLDRGRCIMCGFCADKVPEMFGKSRSHETAVTMRDSLVVVSGENPVKAPSVVQNTARLYRRSLHIRHLDAGDDNATVSEVKLLSSPAYDLHRLGMFFTTSPRHADALLVTGCVTNAMKPILLETFNAMPSPRLVIAAGVEAISGAPFDKSYAVAGGVDQVLPVDIYIPGSPPSPLALLYGLMLATGRSAWK